MDDFSKQIDELQKKALIAGYEMAMKGYTISEVLDMYSKVRVPKCTHPNEKITFRSNDVESVFICNACGEELTSEEQDSFLEWDKQDREDRALKTVNNQNEI